MTSQDIDLNKLEAANPIIQVATELGIKVQGSMGRCFREAIHAPACENLTLFFNPARNTFHCRICSDVGGSVIDLVCQIRGWDRQQAIDWLSHRVEFHELTRQKFHGKGKKK